MSYSKPSLQTYIDARELLSDPSRWVQGSGAVDAKGTPVAAYSEEACRWCLVGAVYKNGGGYAWDELDAVARERGFTFASDLNDQLDHAAVLDLLDTVIERRKAGEG